ncbi:MAG TPA: DUF1573 domain-containing protein [Nitrospirota bacterium]|nr:DUF1573 domain-containing protein [Nitrospirota bacterium]
MLMKPLLTLLLFLMPVLAAAQPAIEFTAERHDFGTVMKGPTLEHAFEFRNAGTEDLIIREVNTT